MYSYYSGQSNTTVIPTHAGRQSTRVTPFRFFFGNNTSRLVTNIQAQPNNSRPVPPPIWPTESPAPTPVYHLPGDLPLKLHEYMVVLEKPVGITLAPDPRTGEVVVQAIKPGSPAAKSGLIQIGDVVRCCSAVFGDDMWGVPDVKPVSWAINNRMGDVRLMMERGRRGARRSGPPGPTNWYFQGKNALATYGRSFMYLPYGCPPTLDENYYTDLSGQGQTLYVSFHRTVPVPRKHVAPAVVISAARAAAVARLRRELLEASGRAQLLEGMPQGRSYTFIPPNTPTTGPDTGTGDVATAGNGSSGEKDSSPTPPDTAPAAADSMGDDSPPEVNVIAPTPEALSSGGEEVGADDGAAGVSSDGEEARPDHIITSSGGDDGAAAAAATATGDAPTSSQSADGSSAGAAPAASTGSGKAPRVVPFLPWLLVSSGPLEHKHINFIASVCRLGSLLELSLTRGQQQTVESAGTAGTAAKDKNGSSSNNYNNNRDDSNGSGDGGRGSNGSASEEAAAAAGVGGYLVVRGSNMTPLFSDRGRVSYPALLAKATAAKEGSGGGASAGESHKSGSSASAFIVPVQGAGADTGEPRAISLTATSGGSLSPGDNVNNGNASTDSGPASSTLAFPNHNFLPNLSPSASGQTTSNNTDGSIGGDRSAAATDPTDPPSVQQHAQQYDPARVRHLLNAAASLQRLVFRRGARLHHMRRNACAVLLHCNEGMEEEVAALLAGWLHWYGKLPLQEASLAAETAFEVTVDQGLLEVATAALLEGARNRATRVILKWRSGEDDPCVTGDVVGSWTTRVPLVPCRSPMGCKGDTQLGQHYLEIYGLLPGVYTYKFIVGGRWTIDRYAPKVLDADRNLNNILRVPEPPQVLTSREGLALARWQAACLALEAKMGLSGLQD